MGTFTATFSDRATVAFPAQPGVPLTITAFSQITPSFPPTGFGIYDATDISTISLVNCVYPVGNVTPVGIKLHNGLIFFCNNPDSNGSYSITWTDT
jgi:hypothetical protein